MGVLVPRGSLGGRSPQALGSWRDPWVIGVPGSRAGGSLNPSHCRLPGWVPAEAGGSPRARGSWGTAGKPSPATGVPQPPPASPPHLHPAP